MFFRTLLIVRRAISTVPTVVVADPDHAGLETLMRSAWYGIQTICIECKCGKSGATLMYTKQADAERMRQAAADVWGLAGERLSGPADFS
jgi:hypothetical protein